jgi:hypothetical protein
MTLPIFIMMNALMAADHEDRLRPATLARSTKRLADAAR